MLTLNTVLFLHLFDFFFQKAEEILQKAGKTHKERIIVSHYLSF